MLGLGAVELIQSMTGTGYATKNGISIYFTSTNSKSLDIKFHSNFSFFLYENEFLKILTKYISRGRVDVYVQISSPNKRVAAINIELLNDYLNLHKRLSRKYNLTEKPSIERLLSLNGVIELKEELPEIKKIKEVFMMALKRLIQSRLKEGRAIATFFRKKIIQIENILARISKLVPESVRVYKLKLDEKIKQILNTVPLDENRLLTEVALLSSKTDIQEEIEKVKYFTNELKNLLKQSQPIGKSLEFILQEMHKEINTMGAKQVYLSLIKEILALKNIIEAIKEQSRNIE